MHVSHPPSPYAPTRFFRLLTERLGTIQDGVVRGDHVLNPEFADHNVSYRDAAVLVPIVAREPEATVLLTVRTANLSDHAGQIAFPGGKIDRGDDSPSAAALREAREEIGLDSSAVDLLGTLPPYLSRTGFRIAPVVAQVSPTHRLTVNPQEVDHAFEVPLAFLMDPTNHRRTSRVFWGKRRYFYEMPFEQHYIWGVTAGIIRELYEQVFV
ncbi:CoA pyrophosphatase [Bauldia sp.]|uniref:CoA pyrophosphatase n=1 Tax=Bauldia sp. TaxID=2575872 RepID=UPI003BA93318